MPHVRYVASNSGGSWFNGVMSFSGVSQRQASMTAAAAAAREQAAEELSTGDRTCSAYGGRTSVSTTHPFPSPAAWANDRGMLCFASQFPLAPFLGPYVPPAGLNRTALSSASLLPPGSWGDTLASKSIVADAVKGVLKDLCRFVFHGPECNAMESWGSGDPSASYAQAGEGSV